VVGYEVAGTIDTLGEGVTGFTKGDRVWALCQFGGHAELVCTRAGMVRRMPAALDFEHAAAVPVVYATALLLISDYGHVQPNERVLIHMAAGGVGSPPSSSSAASPASPSLAPPRPASMTS